MKRKGILEKAYRLKSSLVKKAHSMKTMFVYEKLPPHECRERKGLLHAISVYMND